MEHVFRADISSVFVAMWGVAIFWTLWTLIKISRES